jgi:hypothetical protein
MLLLKIYRLTRGYSLYHPPGWESPEVINCFRPKLLLAAIQNCGIKFVYWLLNTYYALSCSVLLLVFADSKKRIEDTAERAASAISAECCDDVPVKGMQSETLVLDRCSIWIFGWERPNSCRCPGSLSRIRNLNARLSDFRYTFQNIRYWHDLLLQYSTSDWQLLYLTFQPYTHDPSFLFEKEVTAP